MACKFWLLVVLGLLFGLLDVPAASAAIHGSILVACPQGSNLGDGCPQSTGGTFLAVSSPNQWSAYARASGQAWTAPGGAHPWTWNAPGIDYTIGPWTPIAQLKDPKTAPLPAGCAYSEGTNHIGGPAVWCGGSSAVNVTFSGFEFGAAFGHGCVQIIVQPNASGSFTIQNSHFKNGPGCTVLDAVVQGTLNSAANPTQLTVNSVVSGAVVVGDNIDGGDIDQLSTVTSGTGPYNVNIGGCDNHGNPTNTCDATQQTYYIGKTLDAYIQIQYANTNLTSVQILNNTFDGDGANLPLSYTTAFINNGATQGTFTFKYNAFVHIPARVITSAQTAGSMTFQYNYFEDFCYQETDFHCEIWFHVLPSGSTFDLMQVSYNVFLSGKDKHTWPGGTAYAWLGSGNNPVIPTVANTQVDHNIFVSNCVPNGPSGSAGPSATPCSGDKYAYGGAPGNYLSSQLLTALQDRVYVNSSFFNNYFDATGTVNRIVRQGASSCTNPTVFTLNTNVDLVNGGFINTFDAGGGGGGC